VSQRGLTLVELLIVLAILGILVGVVALTLPPILQQAQARAQILELRRVEEAADAQVLLNGALTPRQTPAPVHATDADAPFVSYLRALPSRYAYTWDAAGNVTQYLFEHAGQPMLTPLGNTPQEIAAAMLDLMNGYRAAHARWARSWYPYSYTDLGLDPDYWGQTIEGVRYGPNSGYLGLANVAGDEYQVYVKALDGHEMRLVDSWNVWVSASSGVAYYHNYPRGTPGETLIVVDVASLRVVRTP
jgi:prepilin-type N-terminal cleavage/methylation domain-containing protein